MFKLKNFTRSFGLLVIIITCSTLLVFSFFVNNFGSDSVIKTASSLEDRFHDYRMMSATEFNPDDKIPHVTLLDIDDESLAKINSWPIPRGKWADTLKKLKTYGAKVIAFDVMFPEEAISCGGESPDDIFAKAIVDFQSVPGNKVILAYTTQPTNEMGGFKEIPEDLFNFMLDSQQASENASFSRSLVTTATYPIQTLLDASPELGYISMKEDGDGVFRNYKVAANVDDIYIPSLGLKAYLSYTDDNIKINILSEGLGSVETKNGSFPLNNSGETKIRWKANDYMIDRVPLFKLLEAEESDAALTKIFKNKVVFIASTAIGAHDLRNTPIDPKLPGVMAHINFFHMLAEHFKYQSLEKSILYSGLVMLIGLIILFSVMYFNKPILDLFTILFIVGLFGYLDKIYFMPQGYELKLFYSFTSFILSYSWLTFLNFNQASLEKKQIKGAFSRYVAPSIVDDMLSHPDKLKVGGERKDITCLFSDVRGFTAISEKLTPTELAQCLNRYMGAMTDIVFETEGTLDKYIGDAIVAFWGAPLDIGDHVNKSLDAAVKMLEALPAVNSEFKEQGLPEFKIGLGLNSGECSVGNMGSDTIFAYTALGDTMNLGARLEALCKPYGAQILISEYTYERMDKKRFVTRLIDKVRVVGKEQPVGVYEVLYSYHPFMIDTDSLENFSKAYKLYLESEFEKAKEIFVSILNFHPTDQSSTRLIDKCNYFIETPPVDNEHHITTMTTKG